MSHSTALRSSPSSMDHESRPKPPAPHTPDDSFWRKRRDQALSWYMRWCDDWWLLDILGVIVSCVLIAVLWALFVRYDGRKLQDFDRVFGTSITPNTVVSLLTTISVASSMMVVQDCISQLKWTWYRRTRPLADLEMYDRASRGTLGSALLLCTPRMRSLASIGALLTIIHLAMSPLAQQAVKPTPYPQPAGNGTAYVSHGWGTDKGSNNFFVAGGYNRIRASMKGAVLGGLFVPQDQHLPEITLNCTTGNCTFQPYPSLAVCSEVTDVTSHLTQSAQPAPGKGYTSWCLPNGPCVNNDTARTYPTIANISSAAGLSAHINATPPAVPFAMLNYSSIAFRDRVSPIADFYLIYMNTTHPGYDPAHPAASLQYNAMEFVLDWCVPTYSTNVTNGAATTRRLPNPRFDFQKPEKLTDDGPRGLDPFNMMLRTENQNYTVDQMTHATLQRYMAAALAGDIQIGGDLWQITSTWSDGAQAIWTATQRANNEVFDNGTHQAPSQAAAMATLDNVLRNTAISMSNNVRLVSHQSVSGYMEADAIVVGFAPGYLAAITAFTALTLLFFLLVVLGGGTPRDQPVWKASTNAVLRAVGPQLQRRLGAVGPAAAMAADAACYRVALTKQEEGGWRLAQQSGWARLSPDDDPKA